MHAQSCGLLMHMRFLLRSNYRYKKTATFVQAHIAVFLYLGLANTNLSAGYGNRTRLSSLGSLHTTDVLILHCRASHPDLMDYIILFLIHQT